MASDPSFELQIAIRELLLESDDVAAIVPAQHVIDATKRPELFPRINISVGQVTFDRFFCTAHADLHLWAREEGSETVAALSNAVIEAVSVDPQMDGILRLPSFVCHQLSVDSARRIPDPETEISHAVVSLTATLKAG
jgi:hypothetical protein